MCSYSFDHNAVDNAIMSSTSETKTIASPGSKYLVVEAISFVNIGVTTAGCKKTVFNAKKGYQIEWNCSCQE